MTLEELTQTENYLYSTVLDLYHQKQTLNTDNKLSEVFASYKQVHLQYSLLAKEDSEALKRGLFIQWYALTEPNYLSGINELDERAELIIISLIDARIGNSTLGLELHWMLNYYVTWDYVFQRFQEFSNLKAFVEGANPDQLPEKIDRKAMDKRGQMGMYWNSLNVFKELKNTYTQHNVNTILRPTASHAVYTKPLGNILKNKFENGTLYNFREN